MTYYDKLEEMGNLLTRLEEVWSEEEGRCVKASVELSNGILWWKRSSHNWGFRYQPPDSIESTVALTKAPIDQRFEAIKLLPDLDRQIEIRMAAQDKDLEEALEIVQELLRKAGSDEDA